MWLALLCLCGIIQPPRCRRNCHKVHRMYVEDRMCKREFLSKRKSIVTVVKLHLTYCEIPGKLFSRESSSNPEFGHNPYAAGFARRLLSKWSTRNSNPRRNLTLNTGELPCSFIPSKGGWLQQILRLQK